MFININNIILGCIIIYLFITIQYESNTLLSFIPDYNNNNSNNQNNKNDNEIEKLKKEIIILNNENSSLKDENQRLKNENQRLKSELNNNNQNLKKYELEINKLKLALTNKNNEIKNLKLNSGKKKFIDVDEMLVIQFKSIDQKVDMSYACQKSDIFVRIEEKLYNEFPEYKDLNTYFTVNGRVVKRFRNMEENVIRNNDKILLNIYE